MTPSNSNGNGSWKGYAVIGTVVALILGVVFQFLGTLITFQGEYNGKMLENVSKLNASVDNLAHMVESMSERQVRSGVIRDSAQSVLLREIKAIKGNM